MKASHALMIALLLLVPGTASAQERTIDKSRHLWATVNICDTERSPNAVGIRASMPGSGRKKERMFMRFRLQYKAADGTWTNFTAAVTNSGWQPVGSARYKARQSGWKFPPFEPDAGQRFEVRGVVNFRWRRGDKVVRRATKATSPGHNVTLAEPEGYSAATCEVIG